MLNNFFSKPFLPWVVSTLTWLTFTNTATAGILYDESATGTIDLSDVNLEPTFLGNLSKGSNTLNATFNAASPDYFTLVVPEGLALTNIVLNSWEASNQSGSTFEDIAFFAVKTGNTFDFDLAAGEPGSRAVGLLGWSHLRTTQLQDSQVGNTLIPAEAKILREMSLSDTNPMNNIIGDLYLAEANSNPYDTVPGLTDEEIEVLETRLRTLSDTWESGATGFSLPLESGVYSFWLRQGSDVFIEVDLDFQTASTPEPFSLVALATVICLGITLNKHKLRA